MQETGNVFIRTEPEAEGRPQSNQIRKGHPTKKVTSNFCDGKNTEFFYIRYCDKKSVGSLFDLSRKYYSLLIIKEHQNFTGFYLVV